MSITAAQAAGRRMTFWCMGVHERYDGSEDSVLVMTMGDTASSLHGGTGWELLTVEKSISQTNTTTLTAAIIVAGGIVRSYGVL
jgi:hypothetical protein